MNEPAPLAPLPIVNTTSEAKSILLLIVLGSALACVALPFNPTLAAIVALLTWLAGMERLHRLFRQFRAQKHYAACCAIAAVVAASALLALALVGWMISPTRHG